MIEEVNKYVITLTDLDGLIHIWRSDIRDYGLISLHEIKSFLGAETSFKDILYGYKKPPSQNYFEIKPNKLGNGFIVELKLPEPIFLNKNGLA